MPRAARRTWRRMAIAVVSLALGAAITVGVSWGCLLHASLRGTWSTPTFDMTPMETVPWLWPENVAASEDPPANSVWRSHAFGVENIEVSHQAPMEFHDGVIMNHAMRSQRSRRAGWPMQAMQTRDGYPLRHPWQPRRLTGRVLFNSWEQGIYVEQQVGGPIVLPLTARWPGFAVNTLFYTCVIIAAATGLGAVRRAARRRRGRCPRCNYDLGSLTTCPECGAQPMEASS